MSLNNNHTDEHCVCLWFRGIHDAYEAMDELENLGITHADDNDIVYLKTMQDMGPRGWKFRNREKGIMAKLIVGDRCIADSS